MPHPIISSSLDHYIVAGTSLGGMLLDFMGGLFLAYELLGQKRGPLRMLLRIVLYTVIFSLGYSVSFGLILGWLGGLGLGISLAIELRHSEIPDASCASRRTLTLALFRASVLGIISSCLTNPQFGTCFGLLSAVALLMAYQLRFAPADVAAPGCCPQLTARKFSAALVRGLFIAIAGGIAGHLQGGSAELTRFGLTMGFTVGLVGMMVATCSPYIEWYTDNLSDRLLGFMGMAMIGTGMLLQSVQYFVVLFDVAVK